VAIAVAAVVITACVGTGWYVWRSRPAETRHAGVGRTGRQPPSVDPLIDVHLKSSEDDHSESSTTATDKSPDEQAAQPEKKNSDDLPLEDLVARVGPSVVAIETSTGRGSGFFVQRDTIVTNAHVAGSDLSVRIHRASGDTITARVDRVAADLDLAVLKLPAPIADQAIVELGDMSRVRPGEDVLAIGSPLGVFQNSVTRGIVSAVRASGSLTLIQTDAAINPGNSGGPLMDRRGVVIGINTMGIRNAQNISFAVGVDHARDLLSGQHVATTNNTPIRALNDSMQSSEASDAEMARAKATRTYNAALAAAAGQADQLDSYWRRFKADCYEGKIIGRFDREWFSVFERDKMQGAVSPGCTGSFSTVLNEANAVKRAVTSAEEDARKADVYPGVRRTLRQRYRLDYVGLDR